MHDRIKPEWLAHQRRRFMRPNAHLWLREDAQRFYKPGFGPSGAPERKAGFNPDQPRDEEGRWTDTGGDGEGAGDGSERTLIQLPEIVVTDDFGPGDIGGDGLVRLAGDIPSGDTPPEIPKDSPPTTRLRNLIVRSLTRALGPKIWIVAEGALWIYDHQDEISSFLDPPQSLEELQEAASNPAPGYDIHHIVEQGPAGQDGVSASAD